MCIAPIPATSNLPWENINHPVYQHPSFRPLLLWLQRYSSLFTTDSSLTSMVERLNTLMRRHDRDQHQQLPTRLNFIDAQKHEGLSNSLKYYEQRIAEEGVIETRHHPHDFFGGLCWLAFPHIKSAMNAMHHHDLKNHCSANSLTQSFHNHPPINPRSRVRDFLTLLDEGGMILVIRDSASLDWESLCRSHAWESLFWKHRTAFSQEVVPLLIGHAIYEKLLMPYPSITSRCMFLIQGDNVLKNLQTLALNHRYEEALMQVDQAIALKLMSKPTPHDGTLKDNSEKSSLWAPHHLAPLPIFGIPSWTDNHRAEFYQNSAIFRPAKISRHLSRTNAH